MELANIINHYQEQFIEHYGASSSTQQRHALGSIVACHTERYGEMRLQCSECNIQLTRFHCAGMHRCREAHGCARATIPVVIGAVRGARTTTPRGGWSGNHKNCFP